MAHSHHHTGYTFAGATKAFTVGIMLNLAFVIVEAVAGFLTNSLSLLADAGHNLGDVAGLALALLANKLAAKKATDKLSFGYSQSTILAALVNCVILLLSMGAVSYEAVIRLMHPEPVQGKLVSVIAGVGIIINTATALMFFKDRKKDLNVKGAYLHMAADALISIGVVIAGIIIIFSGWFWLDPLVSLGLVIVIVSGTWGLLKESLRLTMNGVPEGIDLQEVKKYLLSQEGITSVHDLHIWAISTKDTALTVHLIIAGNGHANRLYEKIKEDLDLRFGISHSTIQVEKSDGDFNCGQQCNS